MGRGRMGPSGGSSRGRMGSSGSSRSGLGVGWSRGRSHSHTTIFIGGHRHGHYHGSGSPLIGIVVGAIFAFMGFLTLFGGVVSLFVSPQYLPVNAKYVSYDTGREGWHYRTYSYTIDGVDYTNRSMQSWEFADENDIGKYFTIYYSESDPNEIYEEIPENSGGNGVMIVVGLIFSATGLLVCITSVKDLKKRKDSSDSNGDIGGSSTSETSRIRCPYCGTRYSSNLNNCPQCGASRNE